MLASASSSATSSSARPLIITLDSFDLLTTRPRQALLYCLLDAVQSGSYRPGLAIVGMTRRPDTTDLLEKRVKSRFSHRIVQCYPPSALDEWKQLVGKALSAGEGQDAQLDEAWGKDVQVSGSADASNDTQSLTSLLLADAPRQRYLHGNLASHDRRQQRCSAALPVPIPEHSITEPIISHPLAPPICLLPSPLQWRNRRSRRPAPPAYHAFYASHRRQAP